jgi:hypothetical protein
MFSGIDQATLNLLVALLLGATMGFGARGWLVSEPMPLSLSALPHFVVFAALFPSEASPTRVAAQAEVLIAADAQVRKCMARQRRQTEVIDLNITSKNNTVA